MILSPVIMILNHLLQCFKVTLNHALHHFFYLKKINLFQKVVEFRSSQRSYKHIRRILLPSYVLNHKLNNVSKKVQSNVCVFIPFMIYLMIKQMNNTLIVTMNIHTILQNIKFSYYSFQPQSLLHPFYIYYVQRLQSITSQPSN